MSEYQKAIFDYSKAIENNSMDLNAYYNRGYSYMHYNEYKKAIIDYIKVVPRTLRVEEEVIVGQLITCLDKAKYRFLKNASDSFVSFICQDYFKKQCYYTEK